MQLLNNLFINIFQNRIFLSFKLNLPTLARKSLELITDHEQNQRLFFGLSYRCSSVSETDAKMHQFIKQRQLLIFSNEKGSSWFVCALLLVKTSQMKLGYLSISRYALKWTIRKYWCIILKNIIYSINNKYYVNSSRFFTVILLYMPTTFSIWCCKFNFFIFDKR